MKRRREIRKSASGEELPGWGTTLRWNPDTDLLEVSWWREDTLRRRGATRSARFPSHDVEDALAKVQVVARTFTARRLF